MINPLIESIAFAILLLALLASAVIRRQWFLFLCGFLLPVIHPRVQLGIGIDWYKVVGPIALGLALVFRVRSRTTSESRAPWFLGVMAYVLLLSLIWMPIEYFALQRHRVAAALSMGTSAAQHVYKMPVQLGSILGQMACLFVIPVWARTRQEALLGIRGFLWGVATSFAVGVLSLAALGYGTVGRPEHGLLHVDASYFQRVGGLSGEPKSMGAFLTIALSFLLAQQIFGDDRRIRRRALFLTAAGLLALFLTYSTSAWLATALVLGGMLILGIIRFRQSEKGGLLLLYGALAAVVLSVGVVGSVLEHRTTKRLYGSSAVVEKQKDLYVFQVFRDHPEHIVFGFGPGGGDLAVVRYVEWLHLKYQRTPTPGVLGVRLLADLGLTGLFGIAWVIFLWARRLTQRRSFGGAAFVIVGFVAMCLLSSVALSPFLFVAGGLLQLAALAPRARPASTREPAPTPQVTRSVVPAQ